MKKSGSVTIADVAKCAGVSTATVGRVVGGYGVVTDKTKARVTAAISKLGYSPNVVAQGLRSKKTKTIAVIVGYVSNSFFANMVGAIENEAAEFGYNVIICNTGENTDRERKHIKEMQSRMIDGIILSSAYTLEAASKETDWSPYEHGVPMVLVDRRVEGLNLDVIESDNLEAGYKTANYLIALGHKRIGILGTGNYSTIQDRIKGYKKALNERNIEIQEKRILTIYREKGNRYDDRTIDNFLLDNRDMTAMMILNSSLAEAVLLRINALNGLDANNYSIVCWDDASMNKLLGLTTVMQFPEKIGREAVRSVINLVEKKNEDVAKTRLVGTKLIIRSSCKPV